MGLTSKASASFLSSSELNNNFGFVLDEFMHHVLGVTPYRYQTDPFSNSNLMNTSSSQCLYSHYTGAAFQVVLATPIDNIQGTTGSNIWATTGTTSILDGRFRVAGAGGSAIANGASAIDFKTLTGNSRVVIIGTSDGPNEFHIACATGSVLIFTSYLNEITIDKSLGKAYPNGTGSGIDISGLSNWYPMFTTTAFNSTWDIYAIGYHGKSGGDAPFFQSTAFNLSCSAETGIISSNLVTGAFFSMSANNGTNFSEMTPKVIKTIAAPGSQGVVKIGQNVPLPISTGSSGVSTLGAYSFFADEAP